MKINEFDNSKDNVPITKKDAALYKQAQHMVMKSKVDYKPSVDTMAVSYTHLTLPTILRV